MTKYTPSDKVVAFASWLGSGQDAEVKWLTELWSAVFGSGFEEYSWWVAQEFVRGDWDKPGFVKLKVEDPDADPQADELLAEGPPTVTFTVTPTKLHKAYNQACQEGMVDACTGKRIGDIEQIDSCVGDLLLQLVAFGKEVYA